MAGSHDGNGVNTLVETPGCNASAGKVRWDPAHSLWNGGMLLVAAIPTSIGWVSFAAVNIEAACVARA